MVFASIQRPNIRFWHVVAIAGAAAVPLGMAWRVTTFHLAIAAIVFWLAFFPGRFLRRFRTAPDLSYGMYIYAFPIQQAIIAYLPPMEPLLHFGLAFTLVLIPAALSWYLVEKPALALKIKPKHLKQAPELIGAIIPLRET